MRILLLETTNDGSSWRKPRRDTLFALLALSLFLIYAGFSTYHHEMWRDEMGPWLIGRDSRSILDIFHNIRYDGHPSLWYLLVWPLTKFTANPAAMQWLNLAVSAAAVFLVAAFAPGPRSLRGALVLGYFPVYEYGSIARNYAPGVLALAAFCALFPRRREHPLLLGVLLLLAAHTSMLACLLAIAATCMLALEWVLERSERSGTALAAVGIAAAGILLAVYQMIPPADSGYAMGWHFGFDPARAAQVLKSMTAAYLPLPKPGPGFWETELLAYLSPLWRGFSWLAAPLFLAGTALALLRRPLALAYYLTGTLGLLAFFYAKHTGYLRHHGFLFVCFATALWLAATLKPVRLSAPWDGVSRKIERAGLIVLPLLLLFHLAGAAIAVTGEASYPFSAAKETAELIRQRGLEKLPVVADLDVSGMPVVGYLDKTAAFYPCGDRMGSFVVWDKARMQHSIVWEQAPILAAKAASPMLVVVDDFVMKNFPLPAELQPKVELIGCRKAGIATEESYCVYLLDPRRAAR